MPQYWLKLDKRGEVRMATDPESVLQSEDNAAAK
jgi:hypothetical protein